MADMSLTEDQMEVLADDLADMALEKSGDPVDAALALFGAFLGTLAAHFGRDAAAQFWSSVAEGHEDLRALGRERLAEVLGIGKPQQ